MNIFLLYYDISFFPSHECLSGLLFPTHWPGMALHTLRLWVLRPSLISLTRRVDKRSQPLSPGITLDIALCALQMKSYRRPFGKEEHGG